MPQYTKAQLVEAGRIIAARNPYPYTAEVFEAFRIANDWRSTHVLPMQKMRQELKAKAGKVGWAVTPARLKRMQSIRRKLRNSPYTLYQIQDIAGCRAIVPSMVQANALRKALLAGGERFSVTREDDYISAPRATGYRSYHFRAKLNLEGDMAKLNRYTVEIQVRSNLQHAWATAVEAVGLVRNEELKSGRGDADWLRFFKLMASEFASEEGCPLVPETPQDELTRRAELRMLEGKLEAIKHLESYNQAIKQTESWRTLPGEAFLISYDLTHMEVKVTRAIYSRSGPDNYYAAEGEGKANTVLVEVDKVGDLRAAYPNYFLDVQMFTDRLKRNLGRNPSAKFDLSWWYIKDRFWNRP